MSSASCFLSAILATDSCNYIAGSYNCCSNITALNYSDTMSSVSHKKIRDSFLSLSQEEDFMKYLKGIEDCVWHHRHEEITLNKPFKWRIGPFEDTIFEGDITFLDNWQERYLPDYMLMQVLGTITSNVCTEGCSEVVLLACEDRKVYALYEMEMHLVADNLKELFNEGMCFPGKTMFLYGQCFDDMTKDNIKEESDERKKLDESHKKLLDSLTPSFMESMAAIRQMSKMAVGEERANDQCLDSKWKMSWLECPVPKLNPVKCRHEQVPSTFQDVFSSSSLWA
ncbi:uncharacterized protein LOC143122252 [Alosa pseudoharengus]|uniref:uncharacterized protein LOC143122252 n=1 Tax=Alosa pseudoharengus TaxID=34774 RepID=UPI003F893B14